MKLPALGCWNLVKEASLLTRGEANVCSVLLSGWADPRLEALAAPPTVHPWGWGVREEQGYGKSRTGIALLFYKHAEIDGNGSSWLRALIRGV